MKLVRIDDMEIDEVFKCDRVDSMVEIRVDLDRHQMIARMERLSTYRANRKYDNLVTTIIITEKGLFYENAWNADALVLALDTREEQNLPEEQRKALDRVRRLPSSDRPEE